MSAGRRNRLALRVLHSDAGAAMRAVFFLFSSLRGKTRLEAPRSRAFHAREGEGWDRRGSGGHGRGGRASGRVA